MEGVIDFVWGVDSGPFREEVSLKLDLGGLSGIFQTYGIWNVPNRRNNVQRPQKWCGRL